MTDQEFTQQTHERLKALRGRQRLLHERLARDVGQLFSMRVGLAAVTGALALGLGLSVGYQIGRR